MSFSKIFPGCGAVAIAILLTFVAQQSFAQTQAKCALRANIVKALRAKYGEELSALGFQTVRKSLVAMEIMASEKTGTYTVLLTKPDGTSCIVATGTDFFMKKQEVIVLDSMERTKPPQTGFEMKGKEGDGAQQLQGFRPVTDGQTTRVVIPVEKGQEG